jgi:ABC-type multidrug transport system fused ATPase/permease subunit
MKKINFLFSFSQKKKLYGLLLIIFCVSTMDLLGIGAILPILIIFSDPVFIENEYISLVIKNFDFLNENNFLNYSIIFLLFIFISKTVLSLVLNFIKYRILHSFYAQISNKLMNIYLKLPYSKFIKLKIFEKSNTIKTEIEIFIIGVIDSILIISLEILTIVLISAFLVFYDSNLLLKIFLFGLIITTTLTFFFGRKLKQLGGQKFILNNLLQQQIFQGLQGIKDIKLSLKENLFYKKFSSITNQMSITASSIKALQESPRLIIELFAVFCFVLIAIISNDGQNNFSNLIVTLGIFAAAAFRILPSLNRIVVSINSIKQSHSVINTIYNDFQLENLIVEDEKLNFENEKINKIEIKNLCFKYSESKEYILKDVNLNIDSGDYIGIYGKSGSGKSTFVDLFSGLLTPESGEVYYDNKNITSNPSLWKSVIGYVPQSIYLNHETLKENIAFGEKYENINNQKILNVINLAQLEDLVETIPNGINGIIGENGINLSGGQIQRMGIARALYKDPQILIFDESTNSLDSSTEKEFMNIVNRLRDKKTILFISHQLEILKNCNRLFELKDKNFLKIK